MATIAPTPIPEAPDLPQRSDPATFEERSDAYYAWQSGALPAGIDAQSAAAYQNALDSKSSADAANQSKQDAETAKNNAETARDKAQDWAEGTEPAPGKKSAREWSGTSEEWAGQSEAHKNNAEMFAAAAGAAAGVPAMEGQEGKSLVVVPGENLGDPPKAVWGDVDGNPGDVRRTSEILKAPKWLRANAQYLRTVYPRTAARFLNSPPSSVVAQTTLAGGAAPKKLGLSPNGKDLIVVANQSPLLRAFRESSGVLTSVTINVQPTGYLNMNVMDQITFTDDGQYFCVTHWSQDSGGEITTYDNAVCIYKNDVSGWVKVAELRNSTSPNHYMCAALSPDGASLMVSGFGVAEPFVRYSFNGATLTLTANPCDALPPSGKRAVNMHFSEDGKRFGFTFNSIAIADLTTQFPGYAAYDIGEDGVYRKIVAATITVPAQFSPSLNVLRFSQDSQRLAIMSSAYNGSSTSYLLQYLDMTTSPPGRVTKVVGMMPQRLDFVALSPYSLWLTGPGTGEMYRESLDNGALMTVYSGVVNGTSAASLSSERATHSGLVESVVRILEPAAQFSLPEMFLLPATGLPATDFLTFIRSYDA